MHTLKIWWERTGSWFVRFSIESIGVGITAYLARTWFHSQYTGKPAQFEWDVFALALAVSQGVALLALRSTEANDPPDAP